MRTVPSFQVSHLGQQRDDHRLQLSGRQTIKVGGRWLYQRQGFSYSGNEGILGHFDYTGAFTGFGFSDFLLDQVSAKGQGGLVEPFTHLASRIAIFAQDDLRVRNDLTLNLGMRYDDMTAKYGEGAVFAVPSTATTEGSDSTIPRPLT